MGIHTLIRYLQSHATSIDPSPSTSTNTPSSPTTNTTCITQLEFDDHIYISNITYIDLTHRLIAAYNYFNHSHSHIIYESLMHRVADLRQHIIHDVSSFISRIAKTSRIIHAFVDYKYISDFSISPLLFRDFLSIKCHPHEHVNAIPIIKRKHLHHLLDLISPSIDIDTIPDRLNYIKSKVRCMYEVKSVYAIANDIDISTFISLPFLAKVCRNGDIIDTSIFNPSRESSTSRERRPLSTHQQLLLTSIVDEMIVAGHIRYMMMRGAKYDNRQRRTVKYVNIATSQDVATTSRRIDSYIPFTVIMHMLPSMIDELSANTNVKFFGCELESDFAISSHVHAYYHNAYPTIYTCDTDMVVHLCDVDCVVRLGGRTDNLCINPKQFWRKVFGNDINPRIIKILSVLLGTDYNPRVPNSPIHIDRFDDVLKRLGVKTFAEIDEDMLLLHVYDVMSRNVGNEVCSQTAFAINVYLNNVEGRAHCMTQMDVSERSVKRLLRFVKQCDEDDLVGYAPMNVVAENHARKQ